MGKCACKILNPNNEVVHIRKNTIIETFVPINDNDILTNHTEETLTKQVNDGEQIIDINTVTEQSKKTLKELEIKLENDNL